MAAAGRLAFTELSAIPSLVDGARACFQSGRTLSMKWRKQQLHQILKLMSENEEAIIAALQADLRRPKFEGVIMEISTVVAEVKTALESMDSWVKPTSVATPLGGLPGTSYVHWQPKGVVFIISPWNYPFQLIFNPLAAAIAAGNTAVLKPSECSPACSQLMGELIPRYMDTDAVKVVQGAVEETTALLKEPADHIVYTGNSFVAKIIMRAAAEHLTPVTLELGGKSPAIVTPDTDLPTTARRIVQGRFANNGQTCVAADYVLVDSKIRDKFTAELVNQLNKAYGADPQASSSYGRIVNERHWGRVMGLIESANADAPGSSARLVAGGSGDKADLYIAPTIIADPSPDCKLMHEEVFGPVLSILSYDSIADAVSFVNSRERPLALYVFCRDAGVADKIINNTWSGGVCVNDCLVHVGNTNLPFGGVGTSGMGAYHGVWGFQELSHKKGVMHHPSLPVFDPPERYAPYDDSKIWLLRLMLELEKVPDWVKAGGAVALTGLAALFAHGAGAF